MVDTSYEEQQRQFEELERLKNLTKPRSQSQSSTSSSSNSFASAAKPTPTPPTPQATVLDAAEAPAATQGIFKRFNFPPIDRDFPQLSLSKPLWEIAKEKPTCTKCGMEYTFLKRRVCTNLTRFGGDSCYSTTAVAAAESIVTPVL